MPHFSLFETIFVLTICSVMLCGSKPAEFQNGVPLGERLLQDNGPNVCQMKECYQVSSFIKEFMDETVNPCDDFYKYTCGRWIEKHPIPKNKLQISAFTELRDENTAIMKNALLVDDELSDIEPIKKLRGFFRSCLNTKKIDQLGRRPLHEFIKTFNSWSLFQKEGGWDAKNWNIIDTIRKIQSEYTASNVLFTFEVVPDPMNKGKYILLIDEGDFDINPMILFIAPGILPKMLGYMTNITMLAGVDREEAKEAMKDVLRLETNLTFESLKSKKKFVRIPIHKLEEVIPEFPWFEHLQKLVYPSQIARTDPVLFHDSKYLQKLFKKFAHMDEREKRVYSNFIVWRIMKSFVPMLDHNFRAIYNRIKFGKSEGESRVDFCYDFTSKILSNLMGAVFLKKRFDAKTKADVEEMMTDIIKAFEDNAKEEVWLSKKSGKAVQEKLEKVISNVGYPSYLWESKELVQYYKDLDFKVDEWFNNVLNSQKFLNHQELQRAGKKVDRAKWIAPPQMVNAFYVLTKNEIVIPAGILQEPFFYSGHVPKAISYGAIGHILGHELTHGFDDSGRTFDKYGHRVHFNETGWSKESDKNFKKQSQCLIEQFNGFNVSKTLHVDGKQTLGENIADAGGVKLAYNAYKRWLADHGREQILPNMNKTSDELFFIGFAQKSCSHTSKVGEYMAVKEDDHAPSKFRIIGTLANMKEFSDTYKCPVNSKMNPAKKCDVW